MVGARNCLQTEASMPIQTSGRTPTSPKSPSPVSAKRILNNFTPTTYARFPQTGSLAMLLPKT